MYNNATKGLTGLLLTAPLTALASNPPSQFGMSMPPQLALIEQEADTYTYGFVLDPPIPTLYGGDVDFRSTQSTTLQSHSSHDVSVPPLNSTRSQGEAIINASGTVSGSTSVMRVTADLQFDVQSSLAGTSFVDTDAEYDLVFRVVEFGCAWRVTYLPGPGAATWFGFYKDGAPAIPTLYNHAAYWDSGPQYIPLIPGSTYRLWMQLDGTATNWPGNPPQSHQTRAMGAVYIFCNQADLNMNGAVDTEDLFEMVDHYLSGSVRADLNQDGEVTADDLTRFIDDYLAAP